MHSYLESLEGLSIDELLDLCYALDGELEVEAPGAYERYRTVCYALQLNGVVPCQLTGVSVDSLSASH